MKIDIVESDQPSVQLGIMAELEILRILRLQGFRSFDRMQILGLQTRLVERDGEADVLQRV